MNPSFPQALPEKVIVHAAGLDLPEALRAAAVEKASRLLGYNKHIDCIRLDLERDHTRGEDRQFIAKGQVEFGGPALLASVMSDDPAKAIDYLIEKLDHLLSRGRARRSSADRSPSQ